MFSDLKNVYESISIAEYSKWIENWLSVLAELVDGENNFDDTLDETNEHFLKVCGKSYKPVKYEFHSFCFCEGYILICSSDNYKTYRVYYGTDNDIKLYEHPQEFYKFDERYVVDIWTELKQLPVKEVYEKIRGQQVVENMNVEKKICKQLDYIQSAGRIE
jgi:hypothetical protein